MKGTARTVFAGTEPQEFGVEILGVLPGFPGPRQSAIIAKLTGANVRRPASSPVCQARRFTSTIACRRISPQFSVFRNDRGHTPIQQMIDNLEKGSLAKRKHPKERAPFRLLQLFAIH